MISGERTGYAYSDDLSPEQIVKAAKTAGCIASGPTQVEKTGLESKGSKRIAATSHNVKSRYAKCFWCQGSCRSSMQ